MSYTFRFHGHSVAHKRMRRYPARFNNNKWLLLCRRVSALFFPRAAVISRRDAHNKFNNKLSTASTSNCITHSVKIISVCLHDRRNETGPAYSPSSMLHKCYHHQHAPNCHFRAFNRVWLYLCACTIAWLSVRLGSKVIGTMARQNDVRLALGERNS